MATDTGLAADQTPQGEVHSALTVEEIIDEAIGEVDFVFPGTPAEPCPKPHGHPCNLRSELVQTNLGFGLSVRLTWEATDGLPLDDCEITGFLDYGYIPEGTFYGEHTGLENLSERRFHPPPDHEAILDGSDPQIIDATALSTVVTHRFPPEMLYGWGSTGELGEFTVTQRYMFRCRNGRCRYAARGWWHPLGVEYTITRRIYEHQYPYPVGHEFHGAYLHLGYRFETIKFGPGLPEEGAVSDEATGG